MRGNGSVPDLDGKWKSETRMELLCSPDSCKSVVFMTAAACKTACKSSINDEIIEEEKRRKKPPEPESANHILLANLFLACGRVRVLERSTVDTALKAAAVALGLDPADHATHSLRAGGATALYAIGWPPSKIQRRGRWLSDCWLLYIWPDREEAAGLMEDVVSSPAPLFHI